MKRLTLTVELFGDEGACVQSALALVEAMRKAAHDPKATTDGQRGVLRSWTVGADDLTTEAR